MLEQTIVRKAERSDLRALYEIEVECFPKDAFPLHHIMRFLEDPEFMTLVIILEGKVIGYVTARIEDFEGKRMGHIYSIAVKPEYRRRGVGSKLLKTLEENLRRKGVRVCYLETRVSNIAAINLYFKHGYRIFDILRCYYGDGEDAARFIKIL